MKVVLADEAEVKYRNLKANALDWEVVPREGCPWQSVRIPVAEGACLSGFLGRPQRPRRTPLEAVVLVHGFAAEKTENGLFTEVGERLLRSGYTVLLYDWRGLGESDGDFSHTSLGEHTADFRTVVDWLGSVCGLASTRLCAVGFSLGAALVIQALKDGLTLGASSFWSPAVRPRLSMWPRYNTPELKSELKANGFILKPETKVQLGSQILGSLKDTDLGLTAFSLGIPLLVCHGTDDTRIPIRHTRQVVKRCQQDRVMFAEFVGASHSFRPTQEQRSNLYDLFLRWLSDEGFRSESRRLRMPQDWPPSPEEWPPVAQTAQAAAF